MDEEEFWAWLETLPPDEQERVLYDFTYSNSNALPGTFNQGGFSPQLDYGSFDLGQFNQLPPEMDKQGNVLPWGLDQQSQAYNALQDLGSMSVDNALAMYGGPGSYDPQAFEDVIKPVGQPVVQQGRNRLQSAAESGSGFEAFLAQMMMGDEQNAGMSPSQAVATLWDFLGQPDDALTPDEQARKDALRASLPTARQNGPAGMAPSVDYDNLDYTDRVARSTAFDEQALYEYATRLSEDVSGDAPVGYVDPETGVGYTGMEREPSPLAQKFAAAGLPTPFESYMDEDWLAQAGGGLSEDMMAGRQAVSAEGQRGVESAGANVKKRQGEEDQLARLWQEYIKTAPREVRYEPGGWQEEAASTPASVTGLLGQAPAATTRRTFDPGTFVEIAGRPAANAAPQVRMSGAPIYDFGGSNAENAGAQRAQDTVAKIVGSLGLGPGSEGTRRMRRSDVNAAQGRTAEARRGRQAAFDRQAQLQDRVLPGEIQRARAVGAALALQRSGRNPLNDALMQRSMARNMLLPGG
jgi:hypothetical protein